jgi:hypothetical protein
MYPLYQQLCSYVVSLEPMALRTCRKWRSRYLNLC